MNGCAFCLAMHTDEGRTAGLPQAKLDTVAAWRDDPTFTDRERAALDLAETMTRIADGGRVYLEGESSDKWHRGFGGGIWLAWLGRPNTLSAAVARSPGRTGFYIRAGFLF